MDRMETNGKLHVEKLTGGHASLWHVHQIDEWTNVAHRPRARQSMFIYRLLCDCRLVFQQTQSVH